MEPELFSTQASPDPLPSLKQKIRSAILIPVGLSTLLGLILMVSVFLAGHAGPRLIHVNYDSIAASSRMLESLNALVHPEGFSERSHSEWAARFEEALTFEERNLTEQGERETARKVRESWDQARRSGFENLKPLAADLRQQIGALVELNEKGMFRLSEETRLASLNVFWVSLVLLILTLGVAIQFLNRLATRIAEPIQRMADTLHGNSRFDRSLDLPDPGSLELKVLVHEIGALWERLGRFQKLNIEEITIQQQRLQTILASVEDALLVLDHRGQILHVSDGMSRILEQSREDLEGQSWERLARAGENLLRLKGLFQPGLSEDAVVELNIDGKRRVFGMRSREIASTEKERLGSLYLLHDVTEKRHRERLKTEFIGVLSHELRTPLQSLGTATELLANRKEQMGEEARLLVETIAEDVSRIRAVADDFVQVSLVDLRSLRLKLEELPLSQLLQDWVKPFRLLARDKNVELEFLKEGSETIWANVDSVKLPWAISNVLANAIRVSEPGKKVGVHITDRANMAHIEIRDEGPGIPEAIQRHMFEPYYQGADEQPEGTSGFLGLGLTIAKEVLEAHGGRIEYFARKPRGSIFRLAVPYVITHH